MMVNKKASRVLEKAKYLAFVPVAKATALLGEAQDTGGDVAKGDIFDIMKKFINWAVIAIGLLGVIMFIVAGFQYLTASGDETKMETAKRSVVYAVTGIAVAILGLVAVRTIDYIVK